MPSWLASMLIHLVALLIIGAFGFRAAKENAVPVITGGPVESGDLQELGDGGHDDVTTGTNPLQGGSELSSSLNLDAGLPVDVPLNPLGQTANAVAGACRTQSIWWRTATAEDLLKSIGGGAGNMGQGIGGRTGDAKKNLLKSGGGTAESEDAVGRGAEVAFYSSNARRRLELRFARGAQLQRQVQRCRRRLGCSQWRYRAGATAIFGRGTNASRRSVQKDRATRTVLPDHARKEPRDPMG